MPSGNPGKKRRPGGGRKPGFATQMKRLALAEAEVEAEKSLAVLVKLRDHAKSEGIRLAAAIEIKNTVWGKPKQQMEHSGKVGVNLVDIVAKAEEERGAH